MDIDAVRRRSGATCLGVLAGLSLLTGCGSTHTRSAVACNSSLPSRTLPVWARRGFDPATQPVPYVMGEHGRILGVVFGDPLHSPAVGRQRNKILWVVRQPADPSAGLRITGRRLGAGAVTFNTATGPPGPSIVDAPAPGCWELKLAWGRTTDVVRLRYRPA